MSESKHTPGPWNWDEPMNWHGLSARVFYDPSDQVATVGLKGWGRRRGLANARLIAASPDMLAYAEAVEAWEAALLMTNESWEGGLPRFTQELYDEWMELQAMRNKAIAKAKGESA